MPSKTTLLSLSLALATTASAQSTTIATLLLPDWCVTQSAPTVTVVNQASDLTTYSYSCTTNSAAISAASSKASQIRESAQNAASSLRASLGSLIPDIPQITDLPNPFNDKMKRQDGDCFGLDAFNACIPWEITQGPSYWAVHYTVTDVVAADQVCSFGEGGVASGDATCTASGRVDTRIWGDGDGVHTETFARSEIDEFFIRNTVSVTMGGPAQGELTWIALLFIVCMY
jgi:hypothetical protein